MFGFQEGLRFGTGIELAWVLARLAPGHEFVVPQAQRPLVVIPTALGQTVGEVMDQHARLVDRQVLRDGRVGPGHEGAPVRVGLGGVVGDGPQAVVGAARGNLADVQHIEAVLPLAAGVVEGVDHERHAALAVGHVDLRPADVIADGQPDADAANVPHDQVVAGRIVLLVAASAHALVIAVHNPAVGSDQVKAIGRFGVRIEVMR